MAASKNELEKALSDVFGAIPKAKRASLFWEIHLIQREARGGNYAFELLDVVRSFFLDPANDLAGEDSPFVKRIDQLVPRKESKDATK